jgi:hypothetical protein
LSKYWPLQVNDQYSGQIREKKPRPTFTYAFPVEISSQCLIQNTTTRDVQR